MKNRFVVEQLEPRILLSGDILSQLVPLLNSQEATRMQIEYQQEHPEMRQASIPASLSSDVACEPLCLVVVDNKDVSITEEGLMQPFDNSTAFVGDAVEQQPLLNDFSSDYSFTAAEWDALEDGWRNISSMLGETLAAEGFVPLIPFLDGGSKFYGTGDELTNLLRQPLADYGSSYGESVGGLLDVFSKQWSDGDLVVLGKILGGYDAAKNEASFDLTVRIEKSGKSALDFSSLKDENGPNLTVQDQADYKASLTLDLQFGLNVVSDTFFAVAGDGLLSIKVDDADVTVEALFQSPAGAVSSTATGDIELDASFLILSDHRNLFVTDEQPSGVTASSAGSGMQLALSFAGDDIYQGIESVTVSTSDLFDASSPQIALEGSNLHLWNSTLDANLYVGSGEKLSGSGTLSGSLVNAGLVSPGNSPGIQSVATYTQNAGATLQIEIGGLTPGPGTPNINVGYDQLNITGNANLGGALQVVLLDGYKPTVGDTFDIVTFGGTASGIFTNLTGLYGFDSDHYFEVVQSSNIIQLVTREIIAGDDFSFSTEGLGSAYNDSLGMLLNTQYLVSAAPTSVTLSGNIELGNSFKLGGSFTFAEQVTPSTLKLSNDSTVSTTLITVGGRDLTLLFGSPGDGAGLSISDVDFGLAQFKPVDKNDSRSWLMTKGTIGDAGSASFVNLGPLSVSTGLVSFDISQGLGSGNTPVPNLSSSAVVISDGTGTLATFDSTGSRGEYFDVAATALKFSLADTVSVEGNFMFSSDGTRLAAIGSGVNALFGTADMNIGVTNATIAFLDSKSDGLALQASGGFFANLGSDISLSATGTSLLWKDDGATVLTDTNKTLTIGSSSFTFSNELVSSTGIQEVRVSGAVLQVGDFFTVSGNLAFQKSTSYFVDSKGVEVHADVLTLGSTGLNVFVGANGKIEAERMGLSLTGVDFAFAVAREQGSARQWSALKGSALSASALGIPDVTLSGSNLNVSVNLQASDGTVIDFSQTAFQVATGVGTSMTLDFTGPLVKAAGTFDVGVADFLSLTGSMALEKKSQNLTVQASNGTTSSLAMDILTLGGAGIDAFVGMNGGSAQQLGLVLAGTKFAILMAQEQTGKKRKWSAVKGSAESAALTGVDGMTIAGTGLSVDVNRASIVDASTLDFTGSSYAVAVGPGQSVTLDYRGELVHAEGDITLNLLDFAWFNGHISFDQHSSSAPLTLKSSTGGSSTVSASSMMAITGSNITAFVGYADGGFDSGKTLAQQAGNLYGFGVEGVDLGVLMTKAGSQSYTAVKARMDSAALYGFDSTVFQLAADGIAFDYASADSSGKVIDYAKSFNGGVTLGTFGQTTIDFSSKKLGISTQNATLSIAGSLYVKGSIGFQKEDFGSLKAGSTTVKSSKGFVIGGSNIDLFIGYAENGIDPEKPFALQAGSLYGFGAEGIDFGLMHFSGTGGITYTAAKAHADTVALYGFDPQDFQMSLKGIDLLFNTASSGSAINFKTSFAATGGYSVVTGGAPVLLDMTKETLGVSVNQATLRISDFVYLQGSFEFMKSSNLTLDVRKSVSTLYTGVKVEGFEIGASHVQAFVGIDGPYRSDTNSDGVITSADAVNPDAIGLFIDDLSFGMGVYKATNSLLNKVSGVAGTSFTALKATAATAGFVGVGNFLDLTPKDLRVTINQSSNATWLADFSSNRTIATGDTSSVVLDFSGSLLEASVGHAKANLAGLVSLEGGFTFQKRVLDRIGFNLS